MKISPPAVTTPASPAIVTEGIAMAGGHQVVAANRAIAGSMSSDEIVRRKELVQNLLTTVMVEGTHFGPSFPGDKKKALHKPGADLLLMTFQLMAELEIDERQYEGHHREYRVTARITRISDGLLVAVGIGTCSTLESKYRYRGDKRTCPNCGVVGSIIKGKADYGGGWLCWDKREGCGQKWPAGAHEIEAQVVGKVDNPDPADCWNTCLKIGKKRAVVDGIISATGASDIFAADGDEHDHRGGDRQQEDARPAAAPKRGAPAAAGGVNAGAGPVNAGAAPVNAQVQPVNGAAETNPLRSRMDDAYARLGEVGGAGFAKRVWQAFGNDQRDQRLAALEQAANAIAGIQRTLPQAKADELLTATINDAANPNDIPAIVAALVSAAPAGAVGGGGPVAGGNSPPYAQVDPRWL